MLLKSLNQEAVEHYNFFGLLEDFRTMAKEVDGKTPTQLECLASRNGVIGW